VRCIFFRGSVIAEIADDACLPDEVNERAAKLLARIPEGKV
jgi:hypothetical protein